jgi:hypothetical protein
VTNEEFAAIREEATVRRKERLLADTTFVVECMTGRQLLEKLLALKPYELDLPVCCESGDGGTVDALDLVVTKDYQGISGPLVITEKPARSFVGARIQARRAELNR